MGFSKPLCRSSVLGRIAGAFLLFPLVAMAQGPKEVPPSDTLAAKQALQAAKQLFDAAPSPENNAKVLALCQTVAKAYGSYPVAALPKAEAEQMMGVVQLEQQQYPSAIEWLAQSVQTRKRIRPSLADTTYLTAYLSLGNAHLGLGDYPQALTNFFLAVDIIKRSPVSTESLKVYSSLAILYTIQNNLVQASRYQAEAKRRLYALRGKLPPPDFATMEASLNNNLARLKMEQGKPAEAVPLFASLLAGYPNRDLNRALFYNNLAKTYLDLKKPDSALFFLQQIFRENLPLKGSTYENVVLRNQGRAYAQKKDYSQALALLQAAEQLVANQARRALIYLELAEVYEAQGQLATALRYAQRAIVGLHWEFKNEDPDALPPLNRVVSQPFMLQALQAKARLQTKAFPTARGKALRTYELCISLMDSIRNGFEQEAAKISFTARMYSVYEEAIAAALWLNQPEKAFRFAEMSKANALRLALQNSQARKLIDLGREENELRLKVNRLQERVVLATTSGQAGNQAQADSLNSQLADAERNYRRFVLELERRNPRYYYLKFANQLPSVAGLQAQLLDDRTMLLEYFMGEKQLHIFMVTKAQFRVHTVPIDANFAAQLRSLPGLIQNLKTSYEDRTFQPAMRFWYSQLVQPAEPFLTDQIKRLVVIPDGPLHKLPFDALVKPDGRYLLSRVAVSRGYSGALLLEAAKAARGESQHLFGARQPSELADSLFLVAPFARGDKRYTVSVTRDSLENLPYTQEEAEGIRQLYGATYSLSVDRALKENFLKAYRRYGIIHLSTHAEADDEDPLASFVAFYPRDNDSLRIWRLYTPEIYDLDLADVRLVVLSACETGDGEVLRGEGILSLARAFTYAGCPNLVMTLWNANDQAAKNINLAMYKYLKQGLPKDEALQQAKLDFLDQYGTNTNPYYWANFVFIGDSTPIDFGAPNYWLYLAGGLGLALLFLLFWRIKKR
jgi:CHAT domain-containing protein/predicted negative regulator of RcsB-dependent stress response